MTQYVIPTVAGKVTEMRKDEWFLQIEGGVAFFVGAEKPEIETGDSIELVIRKRG